MTIAQDILKSEVPAFVELFEIDLSTTNIPELLGQTLYLTPIKASTATIGFGTGINYSPFPLEITGIEDSTDAAPARPQLVISNISKYMGSLAFLHSDIIGASVTYIRTFAPYLNLASRLSLPPQKFVIRQKLTHNKLMLTFELGSPLDKERAYLPKWQMLKKDFPGLGVNKRV